MHSFATRVSRYRHLKLLLIAASLAGFLTVKELRAQTTEIRLSVLSVTPAKLKIELEQRPSTTWSFVNTYGRIIGLADRIQNLEGINTRGQSVSVQRVAPGEYRSTEALSTITYELLLPPPTRQSDLSHISSLNPEYGLLMLADLLPQSSSEAEQTQTILNLVLPSEWTSASSIDPIKSNQYLVADAKRAVFLVGRALRERITQAGTTKLKLLTPGGWAFSESDGLKAAAKIVGEYGRVTQHNGPAKASLMLVPLPGAGTDQWSAETRGPNVVVLMGNRASRRASLGRLKVVLSHELFHLWVPNALSLDGDYDWFFEGFTLYQALLTALRLRYIRFEDYLETLGRVYDSYRSSPERDKLSLRDASERRWTASSSLVYDKGMLVAFLYDLLVRRASSGSETVTSVYPKLFRATGNQRDADNQIMSILNSPNGMNRFAEQYIESAGDIDLARVLAPFGLDVVTTGSITQISANEKINSEQRRLLKSLGYK